MTPRTAGIIHHLRRRMVPVGALLVVMAVAASACGSSSGSDGTAHQTIVLYNAQHEQTTDALIAAFTKQTGIKVRVDNDDEDVLTAQIEQEGSRSPADVFYTENSNWLQQLDSGGCWPRSTRRRSPTCPATDSAANGDWVGVSARISVMVYNPSKLTASAAAHVGAWSWPTRNGRARSRSPRRRPTSGRS